MALKAPTHGGGIAPGDVIHDRYMIVQLLEEQPLWFAAYLVEDIRDPARQLIAQVFNVPPLRTGREERIDASLSALDIVRKRDHPALGRVVDWFLEDRRLWAILERPIGVDLGTLLRGRTLERSVEWRAQVALRLAEALVALAHLGQKQAIVGLEPRWIYVSTDARVTLMNFRLDLFLRPGPVKYHRPDTVDGAEPSAIRQFGAILYSILTRTPYEGQAVDESALPLLLGKVAARALDASRPDAYTSLQAVIVDLRVISASPDPSAHLDAAVPSAMPDPDRPPSWDDVAAPPPERPPVWEEVGVLRFLSRTAALGARGAWALYMDQKMSVRVMVALLAIVAVAGWLVIRRHAPVAESGSPNRKVGQAVYVADRKGRVETWLANGGRAASLRPLRREISGIFYDSATQRLCVSVPSENAIEVYWPGDNSLLGTITVEAGIDRVRPASDHGHFALGWEGQLTRLDLRTLSTGEVLQLPEKPVDFAYVEATDSVVMLLAGPPRIAAWSLAEGRVTGEKGLPFEGAALRPTSDGRELWVLPTKGQTYILVVDPLSLEQVGRVELGRGHPIDLGFVDGRGYVLTQEGILHAVDALSRRSVAEVNVGLFPVGMTMASKNELWVASSAQSLTLVTLDPFATRTVNTDVQPAFAAAVP